MCNMTIMSEEDNIPDNGDLSGGEEKIIESETESINTSELRPESAGEITSPITEEEGVSEGSSEVPREVAIREGGEQLQPPTSERQKIKSQTSPKKQTSITKTQRLIVDVSKQIGKQTTQINKINQNLRSIQKQLRAREGETKIVSQIHFQANQIQRQLAEVQKNVQISPSVGLQRLSKITSKGRMGKMKEKK
jgi:hypothetical protein